MKPQERLHDVVETMLARIKFTDEIKRQLLAETEVIVPEGWIYAIAPDGPAFRTYMASYGVDARPLDDRADWRFTKMREVQQGDAVAIKLINNAGTEEEFSGQVHQVVVADDGSKSYIVICPFQVGIEHLRVIVPVEDLAK